MFKRWVALGLVLLLSLNSKVWALDLELTQGVNTALPIGVNPFVADSQGLSSVIEHDLNMSGQFKMVANPRSQEPLSFWQRAGADSVLSGHVSQLGGNRYQVSYELIDAASQGRMLLSKEYTVQGSQLRALAHHISDEVYQKLTGDRGFFSTKIAYITVNRNAGKTLYTLDVADMDGENPQRLLVSPEPIMSPAWSPDGKQIAYVSFEKKRAQIFNVAVATGQRRLITDFPGINGAPSYSPKGNQMAVVLSKGGSPKIYTVDLFNGAMKQVTFGEAIDTEPRYTQDGRAILFTSGRGGSPQIYRLNLSDGRVTRLSYEGNYNARATLTPNEKFLVMLHRDDKQFNIGVQNMSNNQVMTVTHSSMDESPSLSPNGRMILYATHEGDKGVLAVVSIDGSVKLRLPSGEGDVQEPAWSPYLD